MFLLQAVPPRWFDLDPAATPDLAGAFLITLLTLAVFSFLYRDNPFYKLAEHLFIGVGTAWFTMEFYEGGVLDPLVHYLHDAWVVLQGSASDGAASVKLGGYAVAPGWAITWRLMAVVLSLMLLARLVRRDAWVSRWPLALMIGIYAALKMTGETQTKLVKQIQQTMVPLWPADATWDQVAGNLVLVIGLICVLAHFIFTWRRGRVLGSMSRVGIIVLMLAFGSRFGFAVLGRIALLIERVSELAVYGAPAYALSDGGSLAWATTPTFLTGALIVLVLTLAALSRPRAETPPA
jgi:hypothetical protein